MSSAPLARPPARANGYGWLIVAVLVLATILSYTDRQILSLVVDPLRAELGMSDTEVGLLLGTAFAIVYGIAGLPFGLLADRVSRRRLIAVGIGLWSLGTIGCGLAGGFWELFICRMVVGIGEAALSPCAISLIGDEFPPERRGTATGVFLMGIATGAGGAILFGGLVLRLAESGALAATPLGAIAPWRSVLLILGALGAVPAAAVLLLREPARAAGERLDAASLPIDWRRLAWLLLGVGVISLVDNAVLAWSPSVLIREFGIPASRVGVALGALLMLGGSAGVLAGGYLGDRARLRRGRDGQLRLCFVAAGLTAPLALTVVSGHAAIVAAGVALYVACSGVGTAAGIATILDAAPPGRRGFVTAVSFFLNVALGAGVGPPAVALVAGALPGRGPSLAAAIGIVWAAGFALVATAFQLARRREARHPALR